MNRTARLLRLMDVLRGRRRPVTAAQLSERLTVSVRTVYRDVQTLVDLGASIDGSAGVGYLLRSGFFLPPLMFGDEEIEALVLGARWVQGQGDADLVSSADSALAKIAATSPKDLRDKIAEVGLWAPQLKGSAQQSPFLGTIRDAIRRERKLRIAYTGANNVHTERVLWPIALGFFEGSRVVAAWCELRDDFRHFRVDRISQMQCLPAAYPRSRRELVRSWKLQRNRSLPPPQDR